MRLLIFLSLIYFSSCVEFETYQDYLVYANENQIINVDQYSESVGIKDFAKQWSEFKKTYGRKCVDSDEEEKRKFYFLKSLQYIESHKQLIEKGVVSHEVDINEFADWTPEEYDSMLDFSPSPMITNRTLFKTYTEKPLATLPASFDWRDQKKVTGVRNQGQCGSCWAFAAVATIESMAAIKYNYTLDLSEQQLVDCDKTDYGCRGGWLDRVMTYIIKYGIEDEADYPYIVREQQCQNDVKKYHFKINGYYALHSPATDAEIMTAIYNHGPLAVNICSSGNDFKLYRGGIITTGSNRLDHYVTVVGWGPGYWIIKNSWGSNWGESGYARLAQGVNIRGFNSHLFYPTP